MSEHPADAAIVRTTIELAHRLDLRSVAEGVEARDVAEQLAAYGCDLAQGFGLCPPLPADELAAWLRGPDAAPAFEAVPRALVRG